MGDRLDGVFSVSSCYAGCCYGIMKLVMPFRGCGCKTLTCLRRLNNLLGKAPRVPPYNECFASHCCEFTSHLQALWWACENQLHYSRDDLGCIGVGIVLVYYYCVFF